MNRSRHDIHGIPQDLLPNEKNRTVRLVALATIALFALVNPSTLGLPGAHFGTPNHLTMASPSTSGIVITETLNLTQSNVNASRGFKESSWSSNSTTGQIGINSSDLAGETVSAVFRLDQGSLVQAQSIKYDFDFSTSVPIPGPSGPRIIASVGLTSSGYDGWYSQSATPIYPNDTKIVSVSNIEGLYENGSQRSSLVFEARNVTNAQASNSGGNSTILFQREFPGYVAGDGLLHEYSIEIDRQSGRTVWITDDSIIAAFNLSFVPSDLVFIASANDPGNTAIATIKDPVQTAILPSQTITFTSQSSGTLSVYAVSGSSSSILFANITSSIGQISSLQDQITLLHDQVGNLTSQNAQLQSRNAQWFSQWWASIMWGVLGAGVGGFIFVTTTGLKTRRRSAEGLSGTSSSACPQCGGRMPSGASFCGECGTILTETTLLCPECGERMPPAAVYCGDCGTQFTMQGTRPPNGASQTSASESRNEKEEGWR